MYIAKNVRVCDFFLVAFCLFAFLSFFLISTKKLSRFRVSALCRLCEFVSISRFSLCPPTRANRTRARSLSDHSPHNLRENEKAAMRRGDGR